MSNAYRIHGARFLRKYSAADRSSIYSYMADVRKIANTLCKVPWTLVKADIPATTTIHTEEGLDWNEPERDRFDAAEWCGEHSDGFHRAFAQAACYVFKLPASAIGMDIEKLRIQVTGDAYNPYGARISAMTSATLDIPMDCATVREGEVFRAPDAGGMGAAPRLFLRNKDGSQQWYSNTELVELTPQTPLTAKQYLFVFVCLENYNRGRDGWIEGSSYIDNDVELTLGEACEDLAENELNDLSAVVPHVEIPIVVNGVVPDVTGNVGSVVAVNVTASGTSPVFGEDRRLEMPGQIADELSPANSAAGIWTAYGRFMAGMSKVCDILEGSPDRRRCGVGFAVRKAADIPLYDADGVSYNPSIITLTASSFLLPFSIPSGVGVKSILFDWSDWISDHSADADAVFNFWIKDGGFVTECPEDVIRNPAIYDARQKDVGGWSLLGAVKVSEGSASIPLNVNGRTATLLVTAYLPPESVTQSDSDFTCGTGQIWYNDFTPDGLVPISSVMFPLFSESAFYSKGDRVSRGTRLDLISSTPFGDVRKRGNRFFKVSNGMIHSSEDLLTWVSTGVHGDRLDVFFVNGIYFVFQDGSLHSSSDGESFGVCDIEIDSNMAIGSIDKIGDSLVALAGNPGGSDIGQVFFSYDNGSSWEISLNTTSFRYDIVHKIGESVIIHPGGKTFVSSDGRSWAEGVLSDGRINDFGMFGLKYFASIGKRIYSSYDGLSWTDETGELSSNVIKMIFLRNSVVCFAGNDVLESVGGSEWVAVHSFSSLVSVGSVFLVGGEIFVSTIDGKLWRSVDGREWSECTDAFGYSYVGRLTNGIIFGYDIFSSTTEFYLMKQGGRIDFHDVGSKIEYVFGDEKESFFQAGGRVFKVEGESAFVCVDDASAGFFDTSKWRLVDSGVRNRFNGIGDLCVPDVKLIV